ncbi:MAG TPA: site-specific integrase [Bacteroidales bacterium]|nr:site-specific integrase [Bacteroidales bacterium]
MSANTSIILDTRRNKRDNTYPVKLRVYDDITKKSKAYYIKIDQNQKEFDETWGVKKPKAENMDKYRLMTEVLSRANEVLKDIRPFTFEVFERKFFRAKGDGKNVFYYFDLRIDEFKAHKQYSTYTIYECCKKKMKDFLRENSGKEIEYLPFIEITPKWLQNFEDYMLDHGSSRTTVSIYTRAIQAVFNLAIESSDITKDIYPFGKKKYVRPSVKKVKKALTTEHLRILLNAEVKNPYQEKARDFWFFSFATFGMNIKDIALLKWRNIYDDKIVYLRSKTQNTSKKDIEEQEAFLTDISRRVIEKYGTSPRSVNNYVFSILKPGWDEKRQYHAIRNFTRFINQHIKNLAKKLHLPEGISTYWARHSFATKSLRDGYTMDMVGDAFKHSDIKVTYGYFAGLEDSSLKEMARKVTEL